MEEGTAARGLGDETALAPEEDQEREADADSEDIIAYHKAHIC